ncbi:MAG: hypothetical protein Q8L53_16710 [Aestuariivirga sp.]|nr:hypothetical protein [Aestuariivirga sp.]
MTIRPFKHTPIPQTFSSFSDVRSYCRDLYDTILPLRKGKLECTGEITLRANEATTVLNRKGLSPQSVVHFDPKSANAAAELYGGTMYVLTANRTNDVWTITHANDASEDRVYQYTAIG